MSCFNLSKNSIFFFALLAGFFCVDLGASAQNETMSDKSSTVAEVADALDFANFPTPPGAILVSAVRSGLYFTTTEDIDHVNALVSNEMLKRGFTEGDSYRTKIATVTLLMDGRPGTIMLTNSIDGNLTHVTYYHHQGVDVSKVPLLENDGELDRRVDEISYSTKIGVLEGQNLLRQKIDASGIKIARTSTSNGIAQTYFKNGIKFVCHAEESENSEFEMPRESSPKQTRVYITSSGSTDVTKLPMPGRTEESNQPYNSVFGNYRYVVTDRPQDAVKSCSTALQAAGWTPAKATRETVADQQALLIRQGTLLQVDAKQYDNGRTLVQYVLSMLPFDIPNGIETRLISVDTATPHMFFFTTAPVDQVVKFYTAHLPKLGWKPEGEKYQQSTSAEYRNLFKGPYYQPVFLNIVQQDPTSTWVELRPIDFSEVSKLFFAKKDEQPAEAVADSKPDSESATQEGSLADAQANMEKGMENLMRQQLEAALKQLSPEEAAEARKMFESTLKEALGDNLETAENKAADDPQSQTSDAEEMMEAESATESVKAVELADKIGAEDFPVPADAQNVTRDFGMITFSTSKVDEQAKWLDKTLTDLGWKRRGEQMIENDMAILKFQKGTGTINASFILDDRRNPPVHAVIQGDGIHFADDELGGAEMDTEGLVAEEMEGFEASQQHDASDEGEGFQDDQIKEFEGLPLPSRIEGSVKSSTEFRKELTTSIESDVATVFEFFRKSGAESDWKQTTHVHNKDQNATINLVSDRGELQVNLERYDAEVEIHLVFRDPKLAEKHGFLPEAGKGRLILANASESPVTVRINTKTYQLAAGQGAENPKDGILLNVLPGRYNYTITGSNREEQSDKVKVEVGGTWGLVVFPQEGHMAERMY